MSSVKSGPFVTIPPTYEYCRNRGSLSYMRGLLIGTYAHVLVTRFGHEPFTEVVLAPKIRSALYPHEVTVR